MTALAAALLLAAALVPSSALAGQEEMYTLDSPAKPHVMITVSDTTQLFRRAYSGNVYTNCNVAPGVCPAACGPSTHCPRSHLGIRTAAYNFAAADCSPSSWLQNIWPNVPIGAGPARYNGYPFVYTNMGGFCRITSAQFMPVAAFPSPPNPVNIPNPAYDPGFGTVDIRYDNYNTVIKLDEFNFRTTNQYTALRAMLTLAGTTGSIGMLNNIVYGNDYRFGLAKFNRQMLPTGANFPFSPPGKDGEGGCIENYITSDNGGLPGSLVKTGTVFDTMFNHLIPNWNNYPKQWNPLGEMVYEVGRYFFGYAPRYCPIDVPPGQPYKTPWGDGNLAAINDSVADQSYLPVNAFALYLVNQLPSMDNDAVLAAVQCTDATGTNFACGGNINQEFPALEPQIIFGNQGTHFMDDMALELYRRDMILDPSASYSTFPSVVMNGVPVGKCPNFPANHQGNCNRQSVVSDVMSLGLHDDLFLQTAQQTMGRYYALDFGNVAMNVGYDCTDNALSGDCWEGLAKAMVTYFSTLWSRNVNINRSYSLSTPLIDVDYWDPWDCNANRYIVPSFVPTQGTLFEGHLKAYRFGDPTLCELPRISNNNIFDVGGAINSVQSLWDAGQILASWTFANPIGSGVANNKRRVYSSKINNKVFYRVDFEDDGEITPTDLFLDPSDTTSRDAIQERVYRGVTSYWEGGSHLISWKLGDMFHSQPVVVKRPSPFYVDVGIMNLNSNQQESDPSYENFREHNQFRDRVIYVGANDGALHAFWGGTCTPLPPPLDFRCTYGTDANDGREMWAYIPAVMQGGLKEYAAWGQQVIDWPAGEPISSRFVNRRVGVDATPGIADVWIDFNDNQDGSNASYKDCAKGYANYTDCEWRTYLVGGMGLGGRGVYALDIGDVKKNNPADPSPPSVLGEFVYANPPEPTIEPLMQSTALGYTTSTPIIGKIRVCDGNAACDSGGAQRELWVAMFGGGYLPESDPTDPDISYRPAETGGRAFYVVNLRTMKKLFEFSYDPAATDDRANMLYALAAPGRAYDTNSDSFIETVYIGDLGGQIWRFDLSGYGATNLAISAGGQVRTCSGGVTTNCWSGQRLFAAPVPPSSNGKKKCTDKHCVRCTGCGGNLACGQKDPVTREKCFWNCLTCATPFGDNKPWSPFWSAPSIAENTFGQLYVFAGSGDRTSIMSAYSGVNGKIYGIRDVLDGNPSMALPALQENDLSQVTLGNYTTAAYNPNGWFRRLADGEKVLYSPAVTEFLVLFTSFLPQPSVDGLGVPVPWTIERQYIGDAYFYSQDFLTGGRSELAASGFTKNQFWQGVKVGRDIPTAPKVVSRGADATHGTGQKSVIIHTASGEFQKINAPGGGGECLVPPCGGGGDVGRIIYWRDTF